MSNHSFLCFCSCIHLCVHTCTYVCIRVHVPMEAGVLHQGSSLVTLHLIFLKQDLSLNLELADLARLASLQTPETFLSRPPSVWVIGTHNCDQIFFFLGFLHFLEVLFNFFTHECSVSPYTCVPEECVQVS